MTYYILINSKFGKLCQKYNLTMIPHLKGIKGISSKGDSVKIQAEYGYYSYKVPDKKINSKKDLQDWITERFKKALERDKNKGIDIRRKYFLFK